MVPVATLLDTQHYMSVFLVINVYPDLLMSLCMRKPTIWVLTRSDTHQAVQSQKMVRGWKFWILKVEALYCPCSENKGADQLHSYCEADLHLCFRLCRLLVFLCGGSNGKLSISGGNMRYELISNITI